uniref:D-serine dehydratase-like domain-containing protein n=1 Tax=Heterosigma akashiwo TaxID=2829 RepID=A0A7S3Y415_HETAK
MMADLGVCREEDIAVRVLGRVVGHVAATGRLRVDLGWTALSAQGAGRGYGRVLGRPELRLEALSQECGTVGPADPTRPLDLAAYPVGTLLQVLPHHACAATAAHAEARAVAPDGETLLEGGPWPIVRGW